MTILKIARSMLLEDLVVRVYHLDLSQCKNMAEFRECVRLMLRNIDEVLETLACYAPAEQRVRRAADTLKSKAVRLQRLCLGIPESLEEPDGWREVSVYVIANYEQFRIAAGHLYRLAVPHSSFGVLRAAL